MSSIENFNNALLYIEKHLTDEINYKQLAKIALCSEFHFKRVFSFLSGIGLAEYIRKRRLTLAAIEIKNSNLRIIDVAIKYGYGSPDSFSRAFYTMHGVLPSESRNENAQIKLFPKMTFQLSIKGGCELNYRIIDKEPFRLIGLKKRVPIIFSGINPEISKMYQKLTPEVIEKLKSISNVEPSGIISASTNFSEGRMDEKGKLDHYIGVATSHKELKGFNVLEIKAHKWAIFESVGPFPDTLQKTWGRIYSEWFPSSGYESVKGPEILWNESKDTTSSRFRSEIWIPIKKYNVSGV
jgi:AraC family transcriptional regulator